MSASYGRKLFSVNHLAIASIVSIVLAVIVTAIVVNNNKSSNSDGKITTERVDTVVEPGVTEPGATEPPQPQLSAGDSITASSDYKRVDLNNTSGITYTFDYERPPTGDAEQSTGIYFRIGDYKTVGFEQLRSENKLYFRTVAGGGLIYDQTAENPIVMPRSGTFKIVVQFQGPTVAPAELGNEIVRSDFFIGARNIGFITGFTKSKQEVLDQLGRITVLQRLNNFNRSNVTVQLT